MFRRGEVNVLICTNIGSEGMDFRQCQVWLMP
jgi:ERCC4-related helicase